MESLRGHVLAALVLAAVLLLGLMLGAQAEIVDSGTCGVNGGDNLTWTLDSNGVLTISGTGDMADYDGEAPWSEYWGAIKTVEIANGVTSVGNYAFAGYPNLTTLALPAGVTRIGECAFWDCGLTAVTIPATVDTICVGGFQGTSMRSLVFQGTVSQIGDMAFFGNSHLFSVTFPATMTTYNP